MDFLKQKFTLIRLLGFGILVGASTFLMSNTKNNYVISSTADSIQLNSFVEHGFPFISTSIDAGKMGSGFPVNNMSARNLALELGDSAYACFDTDLLRWSVAWTGKFLPMVLMAQVSYKDYFNKNNKIETLTGLPKIATGAYPGWSTIKPGYSSSAEIQPAWKPMPASDGRYNGVYVFGNKAILNYSVRQANIFELPGSIEFDGETAFTRTFEIENTSSELYLTAAEIGNGSGSEIRNGVAYIYQGTSKDTVTAIGILGKANKVSQAVAIDNKYLTIHFDKSEKLTQTSIAIWKGPSRLKSRFEKFCRNAKTAMPDFRKGGPSVWGETVITKGKLSPDTAAFVTDLLNLPLPNPWKRNVRVADIAFFSDGKAAVVTFEGDVWTIEGIDKNLENIRWRRFASGLHEPMSIEVVDKTIYVFDRNGIVKLDDLNADGQADFYENFSNIMPQSAESREWAADMIHIPEGGFYIAKGGSLSNGPGMTPVAGKGFRTGSDQNGTILKIAPDGKSFEVIATGLRGPYLGFNAAKGILTSTDQQGNFVPSSPIYIVKKGDYFGVQPTAHRNDNPTVAAPLTWIPHAVDRSSLGQAWVNSTKMGPLNGNLIHFSFGRPGLFRVLFDSTSKVIQGGISFIHADYPAPTSKGTINPADGQLYSAGFNLWGSSSTGTSALLRLRYTGKPSYLPNHFRAGKQGIVLGFDSEIDESSVSKLDNYLVKRYNYQRTEEYGSGHFKLDGSSGEETLVVTGSYLSSDKKKILLLVPEMTEVMQMEISYHILAKDQRKLNDQFWFTVNSASQMNLEGEGFKNVDLTLLSVQKNKVETAEKSEAVTAARGKQLFQRMACVGCHSEGTKTDGMYGPPFQNLFKSERHFEDGTTAIADEKYLRESILSPSVKIVKGYNEEMPSFVGVLSDSDIESIILHIKSLSKE